MIKNEQILLVAMTIFLSYQFIFGDLRVINIDIKLTNHSLKFQPIQRIINKKNKKLTLNSLYNGRFNWIDYKKIENYNFTFYYSNFLKCKKCEFSSDETPKRNDSKDLLIALSINRYTNIYPYIQSFRSTNSKAQIVIFVDSNIYQFLYSKTPTFFEDCGVNLIPIGEYRETIGRLTYYPKHIATAFFLKTHKGFNRVLFTDLSDVIFQRNPFQIEFHEKFFLVPTEGVQGFGTSHFRKAKEVRVLSTFFSLIPNVNMSEKLSIYRNPSNKRYFNAGLYLTTHDLAAQFSNKIVETLNSLNQTHIDIFDECDFRLEEQDLVNYLIHEVYHDANYFVFDFQIRYEIFCFVGHALNKKYTFPNLKYHSVHIRLFHEIYMQRRFCRSIQTVCPPLFNYNESENWRSGYYRC